MTPVTISAAESVTLGTGKKHVVGANYAEMHDSGPGRRKRSGTRNGHRSFRDVSRKETGSLCLVDAGPVDSPVCHHSLGLALFELQLANSAKLLAGEHGVVDVLD